MSSVLTIVIAYISEGLTILSLNVVLALSILLNKSLRQRKELVFIVGLAISDAVYGAGLAEYGRDELFDVYLSQAALLPTTPWSCFLKPREWLIYYPCQVSLLIVCLISAERLIAVASFDKYALIKYSSHLYILFAAFLLPLITVSAAGYECFTTTNEGVILANDCQDYSKVYFTILPIMRLIMGILSVLLYAIVAVVYKAKVLPIAIQANTQAEQLAIRNKRFTQTVALIAGCMLLFYCIPLGGVEILNKLNMHSSTYSTAFLDIYIFVPLQYIAYVLVFYWRQKEIRQSVTEFICCNAKTNL